MGEHPGGILWGAAGQQLVPVQGLPDLGYQTPGIPHWQDGFLPHSSHLVKLPAALPTCHVTLPSILASRGPRQPATDHDPRYVFKE